MNNKKSKNFICFALLLVLLLVLSNSVFAARPAPACDVDFYSVHTDGTVECYVTWENIPEAKGFMLRVFDYVSPDYEWGYSYTVLRGAGKNYSSTAYIESVIPPFSTQHRLVLVLEVCDAKGIPIDSCTSSEEFVYYPPSP